MLFMYSSRGMVLEQYGAVSTGAVSWLAKSSTATTSRNIVIETKRLEYSEASNSEPSQKQATSL